MLTIEWRTYEAGHCRHPECSTRRGGAWKSTAFPALAFLLRHPTRGLVLFDTGYSSHVFAATRRLPERLYRIAVPPHLDAGESLRSQLARDGIDQREIAFVVLSHLHADHIGGLRDFPHATPLCSRIAWDDLCSRGRLSALRHGLLPGLLPENFAQRVHWTEELPRVGLSRALAEFGAGHDIFGDGSLLAIPLPGHAAGQFGLFFRSPDDREIFLVADAVWSSQTLRDGVPPPRLVTAWLGDTRSYLSTLARLQRLQGAGDGLLMVPSHCAEQRPR